MPDTQQGATMTLSSGAVASITSISRVGQEVVSLDTVHLGTTGQRTMIPGDLETLQELTIEFLNDPTAAEVPLKTQLTMTITGPLPAGGATGEIYAGTGFFRKKEAPEFQSASEALQTKTLIWQFDGGENDGDAMARTAATLT